MTSSIRKTDAPFHEPTQTSRFVEIGGSWYFLTRERDLQGPFSSRRSAEVGLQVYLQAELGQPGSDAEAALADESCQDSASKQADEVDRSNVVAWQSRRANLL